MHEAQQAWMRGHYALAIDRARAALEREATAAQASQAYEIIGACSCAIGEGNAAREAAAHLGEARRETVKAACAKQGLTIE